MTGRLVHIDFRKWMTTRHWQFDMYWMDEDEYGTWLWTPAGSAARRGYEEPRTFTHLNVKLVVPGQWWTAIWNDGGKYDLYIDTITPPAWSGDRVTMIDLDLDLARQTDGTVTIEDEDEFALHQDIYSYPPYIIDKAQAVTTATKARVENHEEPFDQVGAAMVARAQALAAQLPTP